MTFPYHHIKRRTDAKGIIIKQHTKICYKVVNDRL